MGNSWKLTEKNVISHLENKKYLTMSKKIEEKEDGFSQVEKSLTAGEQFIEKNQKLIIRSVIGILVVLVAVFGWKKYIYEPNVTEAENQIYTAQQYFEADSFNLALNGDGNALGFLDIADQYSSTPSGNLANLYSGICYLKLGEYQNAIDYLSKFSSDDALLGNMAKANMGDAYMELGDFQKAAKMYDEAASSNVNKLTTPQFMLKKGIALMQANDNEAAVKVFETIASEYPEFADDIQVQIEKYISNAKYSK